MINRMMGLVTAFVALVAGAADMPQILRAEQPATGGMWLAEAAAKVPDTFTMPHNPLSPDTRRRMVVLPFEYETGGGVTVDGINYEPNRIAQQLEEQLNDRLTRSRKFTMLDRSFENTAAQELARLKQQGMERDDVLLRAGKLLATDYIATGRIRLHEPPAARRRPFSLAVDQVDGTFLEVVSRVLLAPTGQQKWSRTVRIPYSASGAGVAGKGDVVAALAAYAAGEVTADLLDSIYPIQVVDVTAGRELALNCGDLAEGTPLEIYARGDELTDPVNGESLGMSETLTATARIVRATAKVSYAEVITGNIRAVQRGAVARRVRLEPDATADRQPDADGVELPGDAARKEMKK